MVITRVIGGVLVPSFICILLETRPLQIFASPLQTDKAQLLEYLHPSKILLWSILLLFNPSVRLSEDLSLFQFFYIILVLLTK